jgi:hypothetical protein
MSIIFALYDSFTLMHIHQFYSYHPNIQHIEDSVMNAKVATSDGAVAGKSSKTYLSRFV